MLSIPLDQPFANHPFEFWDTQFTNQLLCCILHMWLSNLFCFFCL
jgi:hypothetical protein